MRPIRLNHYNMTDFVSAAKSGDLTVVNEHLQNGVNIDLQDRSGVGTTPGE